MYHSRALTKEDLFNEIGKAHEQGLIKTINISPGTLLIELPPHMHYSKTYDLFDYLRSKYSNVVAPPFIIFVSGSKTILIIF